MSKVTLYVGKYVDQIKFQQGGGPYGINEGEVIINPVNETYRILPETGKHSSVFAKEFAEDVVRCQGLWDLHVSTHSHVLISVLGSMIDIGLLSKDNVQIVMMNEDNSIVEITGFDDNGYLLEEWIPGFMDWEDDFLINGIKP